jgi:hypothetical protein
MTRKYPGKIRHSLRLCNCISKVNLSQVYEVRRSSMDVFKTIRFGETCIVFCEVFPHKRSRYSHVAAKTSFMFFRRGETHEDNAGCIVDEDEQRAARSTTFEPVMIAAVELDHRANMGLSGSLLPVFCALAYRRHQSRDRQPSPQRLMINDKPLVDVQPLGEKRWTVIAVFPAMQLEDLFSDSSTETAV